MRIQPTVESLRDYYKNNVTIKKTEKDLVDRALRSLVTEKPSAEVLQRRIILDYGLGGHVVCKPKPKKWTPTGQEAYAQLLLWWRIYNGGSHPRSHTGVPQGVFGLDGCSFIAGGPEVPRHVLYFHTEERATRFEKHFRDLIEIARNYLRRASTSREESEVIFG